MKTPVAAAVIASLLSIGGALPSEAAAAAQTTKPEATASASPKSATHSKKKVHHVKHAKKSKATAGKSHPA